MAQKYLPEHSYQADSLQKWFVQKMARKETNAGLPVEKEKLV